MNRIIWLILMISTSNILAQTTQTTSDSTDTLIPNVQNVPPARSDVIWSVTGVGPTTTTTNTAGYAFPLSQIQNPNTNTICPAYTCGYVYCSMASPMTSSNQIVYNEDWYDAQIIPNLSPGQNNYLFPASNGVYTNYASAEGEGGNYNVSQNCVVICYIAPIYTQPGQICNPN